MAGSEDRPPTTTKAEAAANPHSMTDKKDYHNPLDPYCDTYRSGTVRRSGEVCIDCLIDQQRKARRRPKPDWVVKTERWLTRAA